MRGTNPFGVLEARPKNSRPVEFWLCERSDGWVCHVPELPAATVQRQPDEQTAYERSRHFVASIVNRATNIKTEVKWQPKPAAPSHVKVRRLRVATLDVKDLK